MRRPVLALIAFAVLAVGLPAAGVFEGLGPSLAAAAEGAAKQDGPVPTIPQGIMSAITALVVFGIVVFILGSTVWPKITKGLDDRANKIRSEIEAAEAARAQARSALEEYEKSLSEARTEAQRMLDETKTQQAALSADLRAKADRELSAMRDRAMRDIESAKKAALNEIYAESVNLATMIASKILAREVTAKDQDRLIEESLGELKSVARNN